MLHHHHLRHHATRRRLLQTGTGLIAGLALKRSQEKTIMARGRGAAARHDPGTPDATAPIVEPESGPVRGVRHDGYRLFQGIPYAAPPVGRRRWRAPEPVAPWTDPLDATRPGGMSPQLATVYAAVDSLSENCLYLNVTTPDAATPEARKPIMVWIHGGGGTNGAGDFFDLRRLVVDEDVIVVTFNYRLGHLWRLWLPRPGGWGQLRFARSAGGLAMGPAQRRGVWRRS